MQLLGFFPENHVFQVQTVDLIKSGAEKGTKRGRYIFGGQDDKNGNRQSCTLDSEKCTITKDQKIKCVKVELYFWRQPKMHSEVAEVGALQIFLSLVYFLWLSVQGIF